MLKFLYEYYIIKKSGLFDKKYYLENNPDVSEENIDPLCHFLRFGWKEGRNPSESFDINDFRDQNPEAFEEVQNPFMVFIKGNKFTESMRRSIDKDKRKANFSSHRSHLEGDISTSTHNIAKSHHIEKHIEFMGINGSGKSSLYLEANNFLFHKLGYRPGPTKLWMSMISDSRIKKCGIDALQLLLDFYNNNNQLFRNVLKANNYVTNYEGLIPGAQDISLQYFFILCAYYQAIKKISDESWCMFDEGYFSNLAPLVYSADQMNNNQLSDAILKDIPKVDILFHIKTDLDKSMERLNKRASGIPELYRHLDDEAFYELLVLAEKIYDHMAKRARNANILVIPVNNNASMEHAKSQIMSAIKSIG